MPKKLGNGSAWKTHPKEYDSYMKARRRCDGLSSEKDRRNYFDRGIEFRFGTFWDFFDEVGPCPAGHTLDRIDVNGHYEVGNVRWADPVTQGRNKRDTRMITYEGKTQSLADWCEELDLNYNRTYARLYKLNMSVSLSFSSSYRPKAS